MGHRPQSAHSRPNSSTVERDGGHPVAPGGVADQDGEPLAILLIRAGGVEDTAGMQVEFVHRERRHGPVRCDVFTDGRAQTLTVGLGLWHLVAVGRRRFGGFRQVKGAGRFEGCGHTYPS